MGKKWIHEDKDPLSVLEEKIKREIKLHPEVSWYGLSLSARELDYKNYEVEVEVRGEVYDILFVQKKKILLRIHMAYCDVCSRRVSGYYEAVIQIRGEEEKVEEITGEIRRRFKEDPKAFILKEEEEREGRDFYVSNSKLAKKVIRELQNKYGGEIKETATLYTRKEGKDVYRMTYLLRLPQISKGDIVILGDDVYFVEKVYRHSVELVNARTGERRKEDYQEIERKGRILKVNPQEAIVLYSRGDEIYVMDPVNYSQKAVKKLGNVVGEKIKVVKLGEELFHYPF